MNCVSSCFGMMMVMVMVMTMMIVMVVLMMVVMVMMKGMKEPLCCLSHPFLSAWSEQIGPTMLLYYQLYLVLNCILLYCTFLAWSTTNWVNNHLASVLFASKLKLAVSYFQLQFVVKGIMLCAGTAVPLCACIFYCILYSTVLRISHSAQKGQTLQFARKLNCIIQWMIILS